MIDVKSGANYNSGFPVLGNATVFICPPPRPDPYSSQDLYNPVYEELSNGEWEFWITCDVDDTATFKEAK